MSTPTGEKQSPEEKRLDVLQRSGLLDSPPEKIFDRLTELAAKALDVPVVLMSLVDRDRQFFKSQIGLPNEWAEKRETPLSHSFCQYVAASKEPLVVRDAREYPLVCDNLAVRDLNVTAYAGVPLTAATGETLGSLCAIATEPRDWTAEDMETLNAMAAQMMTEINLRLEVGELHEDLRECRAESDERKKRVAQNVHDLRTPVTSVLISIDAVQMAGALNDKQGEFLDLAKSNARALRDLVNQVLKASSVSEKGAAALTMSDCSPKEIVERAVDQVSPLAERAGISLDCAGVKNLPSMRGDEHELLRVVVNLLANAIKFTPRGRGVAVALDSTGTNGSSKVRFTVMDEGIGIAQQDQAKLFQHGGRLDHSADSAFSTGIGLAYCKRIVEAHGGEIEVRSALGAGSTFSFSIPRK